MSDLLILKDNEFRLLHLHPSPNAESPIKGSLLKVTARTAGRYDALSYVWGNLSDNVSIVVNGTEVAATRNLEAALRRLRQGLAAPLKLWIDAVCINQSNIEERNHQVKYMGEIYRRAIHVYMWIGEVGSDTGAAAQLLKTCLEPCGFNFSPCGTSCSAPITPQYDHRNVRDGQRLAERFAPAFADDRWGCLALTSLLSRPYWRRMWIFQEVVLAVYPIVQCGPYAIPWTAFQYLDAATVDPHIWLPLQSKHSWILPLRRALFGTSHLFMSVHEASVPDNVLFPTRHLESSDPRDKIYGLMGIWAQRPDELKRFGLDHQTSIDYSRSVRETYTDFASRVIMAQGDLSLLLTAGLQHPTSRDLDLGIPSWVPDLRGASGVDVRFLASSHLGHFDASSGQSYHFKPPESNQEFRAIVKGVVIDTIRNEIKDIKRAALIEVGNLTSSGLRHPSGFTWLRVFFSTMIFEHRNFLTGDTETERAANRDWRKRLAFGFCRELEDFNSGPPCASTARFNIPAFLNSLKTDHQKQRYSGHIDKDDRDSEDEEERAMASPADEYAELRGDEKEMEAFRREYLNRCGYQATNNASSSSSFFVAEKGHIGIGPRTCQVGDRLTLLAGCPTPLVLRTAKQDIPGGIPSYQLVGPCFLFGMMNGEVFKDDVAIHNMYLV